MIRPYQDVYRESLVKLNKYQKGEITPIVTNRPWLDDTFGGILPGDVIIIGGASGSGKSFELQKLINNIFNYNNSSEYVCLINSLEMRNLATIMRDFKTLLNKSKKDILTQTFTEEEKEILKNYSKMYTEGDRFFINEETDSAKNLGEAWEKFLKGNEDKEACFITFDHAALVEGGEKKDIDDLLAQINRLKGAYPNSIFIILSQLNRKILTRIAEKDNMSAPVRGDMYNSDSMFFLADHVYVINNANRLGINEYLKVNPDHYDYLSEHFSDDGNRVSFLTYGKLFYHILKSREADVVFRNLYIEDLEVPERKQERDLSEFVSEDFEDIEDVFRQEEQRKEEEADKYKIE